MSDSKPESPGETSIGSDIAPIPPPAVEEKKGREDVQPPAPASAGAESPAGPPPPSPIATLQAEKDEGIHKAIDRTTEEKQSSKERSKASSDGTPKPDATGESHKNKAHEDASGPTDAGEKSAPLGPDGVPLQEATFIYWASLDEAARKVCYEAIDVYFHNLLEDFRVNANAAVKNYTKFGKWNTRWRLLLIIATGGLAIINVLAANEETNTWALLGMRLSVAAAVYAAFLALLTNLESFLNYPDKKSSTRESRELYLDAYRQFEMLRLMHVYPYGYSAQACFNFNEIYRRLVLKDLELRRKIMQLSTSRTGLGKA